MEFKLTNEQYNEIKKDVLSKQYDFTFEKKKLKAHLGEDLYKQFKKHNAIIAGGMITSLFTNKEINDVDVYFRNNKELYAFAEYGLDGAFIISHTKKATQYVEKNGDKDIPVQLIHYKYYDKAHDVFDTFDFTVCMGAYDFDTEEFILHPEFLKHNSQRLLKFNAKTDYPLISAIRIHKYEDRGYKISKPEYFRIIMACMNLNIESYDDLKEHLGGMYGINYDRLFEDIEDEEFNLQSAIELIGNLTLQDEYFKEWKPVEYNVDEILDELDKSEKVVMKLLGGNYRLLDGKLKECGEYETYTEVNPTEHFEGKKYYKFVEKKGNRYFSFHASSFEYKLNEEVKSEREYTGGNYGKLFFNHKDKVNHSTYFNRTNGVLIEVSVKGEHVIEVSDRELRATHCTVLREVPQEEWKQWINTKVDVDDLF